MPVANAFAMEDVLDACRYYIEQTGRRVIFEYALVDQLNSRPEHAAELAQRLRGMQCHVNVIPLNSVEEKALRGASSALCRSWNAGISPLPAAAKWATTSTARADSCAAIIWPIRRSGRNKHSFVEDYSHESVYENPSWACA